MTWAIQAEDKRECPEIKRWWLCCVQQTEDSKPETIFQCSQGRMPMGGVPGRCSCTGLYLQKATDANLSRVILSKKPAHFMVTSRREKGRCVSEVDIEICADRSSCSSFVKIWAEHWLWEGEEGKHLKTVKLIRKRGVEQRGKKEILRFMASAVASGKVRIRGRGADVLGNFYLTFIPILSKWSIYSGS